MERPQMKAAFVAQPSTEDPAGAVGVGELPVPEAPDGWVEAEVRAGALNMHDVFTLRGIAKPAGAGPHVIGSDAAVVHNGQPFVVYPVLPADTAGRTVAHATLLPDAGHGMLAERVVVPEAHLVPKPEALSWEEAACLPTAWLTAWRMLFTKAQAGPGKLVLVQGAGGGVATAATALAVAAGATVVVTSRSAGKRERSLALGAAAALESGARLPQLADIVVETVGPATFEHSMLSTRAGGTIVVCGGSTGFTAPLHLARLFAREVTVCGSTMGTLEEFRDLVAFVDAHGIRPTVDSTADLADAGKQVGRMLAGDAFGKLCVRVA
ncbi:zinc-binding dehydrogenase [Dactylosporangium sp. CS-033363]|uniref:zinc-binding dehydrogenase n=1 Tax=Dactylosporangium sp. CS-033363 TaxID=3239935 RepID=UPI003D90DF79